MRGEVVYLFAFDVANEIVMRKVGEVLSSPTFPFEVPIDHTYPKETPLYRPLTIAPLQGQATVRGQAVRIEVRIFEVGVVNLAMHAPFDVAVLEDLVPYHAAVSDEGRPLRELARHLCDQICLSLREALVRGAAPSDPEAYTIFSITELGEADDAPAWFADHRHEVAGLLSQWPAANLSDDQVEESLRVRRSFARSDLVVIDWDASLLVELDGRADDVLFAIELANLQLEEYRVMDGRLDRHSDQAYHDLEHARSVWFGAPHRKLVWLRRFRVDATKLADEVTHITKFFGDWHLARVYLGARERFHLPEWQRSIEQRLSQLDEVYRVIQSDIYERRMLWLEIAIVICFVVDLLGLFLWKR